MPWKLIGTYNWHIQSNGQIVRAKAAFLSKMIDAANGIDEEEKEGNQVK
jgi:hypothetical protein